MGQLISIGGYWKSLIEVPFRKTTVCSLPRQRNFLSPSTMTVLTVDLSESGSPPRIPIRKQNIKVYSVKPLTFWGLFGKGTSITLI